MNLKSDVDSDTLRDEIVTLLNEARLFDVFVSIVPDAIARNVEQTGGNTIPIRLGSPHALLGPPLIGSMLGGLLELQKMDDTWQTLELSCFHGVSRGACPPG